MKVVDATSLIEVQRIRAEVHHEHGSDARPHARLRASIMHRPHARNLSPMSQPQFHPLAHSTPVAQGFLRSAATTHTDLEGLARGLSRTISAATALWSVALIARVAQIACDLSGGREALASHAAQKGDSANAGLPAIASVSSWCGMVADTLAAPAFLATGALAALALASFMVIMRGRSVRAGATTVALALYATLLVSRDEARGLLGTVDPSMFALLVRAAVAVGCVCLAWRWIEDVALAAALAPKVDPLSIDEATEREATLAGVRGMDTSDAVSRRLDRALQRPSAQQHEFESIQSEPGLHGKGSPIPRMMPSDDLPMAHSA